MSLEGKKQAAPVEKAGEAKGSLREKGREDTVASLANLRGQLPDPEKAKEILADRELLAKSSVRDIRFNTRFLLKKGAKAEQKQASPELITDLRAETARRTNAYTSAYDKKEGWHTLRYPNAKQELNIGLGDVLLDPSIVEVEIWIDGAENSFKATRGIVKDGQYKGRIGFLDQNGEYVATHTNDRFRISKDIDIKDKQGLATCVSRLGEENKARDEEEKTFSEITETSMGVSNLDVRMTNGDLASGNPISDEKIVSQLNKHREKRDGEAILSYSKEVCQRFGIPFVIYKELIKAESSWIPGIKYEGPVKSDAAGLGQFLGGTWKSFLAYCKRENVHDSKWQKDPPEVTDPYANAFATAWLMNGTKQAFAGLEGKPLYEQTFTYYLSHHEGIAGAKRYFNFLEAMQKDGLYSQSDMADNYDKHKNILSSAQRGRISQYGLAGFLNVYFRTTKRISAAVAKSDPASQELIQKQSEKIAESQEGQINFVKRQGGNIPEIIRVKSGQSSVVLGSSIGVGFGLAIGEADKYKPIGETGVIGLGGYDAGRAYNRLTSEIWPEMEARKITPPKEVVLMGFAINSFAGKMSPEQDIQNHMKIVKFLEGKGVQVKIAKVHSCTELQRSNWGKEPPEYVSILEPIQRFNEILRTQYPQYYLDTGTADASMTHPGANYYLAVNKEIKRQYEQDRVA